MADTFKLPRRLYLTADEQHVVEEGDVRARSLLGPEGEPIPIQLAIRLGLVTPEGAEVKEREPAETKEVYPDKTKRSKAPVKKK